MLRVRRWEGSRPPRESELRAELEAEGYSVYAWTDGPQAAYPPHSHDDDQSHWVLRGSLALTIAGNEYVLGPGDRDWLPAGTVHSARVIDGPATYLIASKPGMPTSSGT